MFWLSVIHRILRPPSVTVLLDTSGLPFFSSPWNPCSLTQSRNHCLDGLQNSLLHQNELISLCSHSPLAFLPHFSRFWSWRNSEQAACVRLEIAQGCYSAFSLSVAFFCILRGLRVAGSSRPLGRCQLSRLLLESGSGCRGWEVG